MSTLKEAVLSYIDEQLNSILAAPGMWGSGESVEFQFIQLLEFRSVILRPELEKTNPRSVLDDYQKFLGEAFPGSHPAPLFRLVAKHRREQDFTSLLERFSVRQKQVLSRHIENQQHDIIIKLNLSKSYHTPRASTLSSYYEIFHRVLRAVSRRRGTRGLASHDIEEAIDFTLPDVIIQQANGAPASITMPLDQLESAEREDVSRGISNLVAVSEWAADPDGSVESLVNSIPHEEYPERIAAQALRLIPGEDLAVQTVELSGTLIRRPKPVVLMPFYGERMVEVVRTRRKGRKFNEFGTIRAVDIDQLSMRIKTKNRTYKCWLKDRTLLERAKRALGRSAQIVGTIYNTPGSPVVVDVKDIDIH
ncbi:hypothetical protein COCOR_04803 [Corallococcus coralloides DSM 2259]|uniref:Uncharacterized protein n=1 Tax=Corallococcus coralloides (strain ATCC 25202 / DSM 2259 / NBRC 100086 / M2) TaxID=1144275 RepID=H8MKX3_CORCM|nr:hypothetical protein [Corallococcus coralloides]AFE06038.1 hypothetical protein COCOR_04803 [Corallococcus coralloides DSM 2259]